MLLLIEIFDTIAGIFVLTEVCLVLLRIEFRIIIPQLQLLDVHCKRGQSQTSGPVIKMSSCRKSAPTFVDGVGDLVKGTAIALLGDNMGVGEGGHCREESR